MFHLCIFFFHDFDICPTTKHIPPSKVVGYTWADVAGEGVPTARPSDSRGLIDNKGPIAGHAMVEAE
jgi:hypothetical protein